MEKSCIWSLSSRYVTTHIDTSDNKLINITSYDVIFYRKFHRLESDGGGRGREAEGGGGRI